MGGFFHGWRRKIGVMTLVMACVFMGGWVRSQSAADMIVFSTGQHAFHQLFSEEHGLTWQRGYDPESRLRGVIPVWTTHNVPFFPKDKTPAIYAVWQWRLWGFSLDEYPFDYDGKDAHLVFWTIPYWYIIIPLTLVSAYLLLIEPYSTTMKNVEYHWLKAIVGIIKDARQGWRGRVGIIALTLTCLFAGWWVRSLFVQDFIDFQSFAKFPIEKDALAGIGTKRHSLVCLAFDGITLEIPPSPSKETVQVGFDDANGLEPIPEPAWSIYSTLKPEPFLIIPFWSITIPLTLISVWLLIKKPSKSNAEKNVEPIL